MVLKTLKIKKFKTFENAELDFHKNLNVIVGPSCSGKTILLQSILFALGEHIRSKDNFAEAELIVDTTKERKKHKTIFKRVEKDRDSIQFIDGKKRTRRRYLDKLKELGLECNDKNIYADGIFDLEYQNGDFTLNEKINLDYPFYIYDSFDARLDPKHLKKFMKNLKNKGKQFIVVTNNDKIIHIADKIYGMSFGAIKSKIISLR